MANKNNEFIYLNSHIPESAKRYRTVKTAWGGINYLNNIDSGELSESNNILVSSLPQLIPADKPIVYKTGYARPISMYGFKDFLLVIYRADNKILADYITDTSTYTGTIKASGATLSDEYERSVVQFNIYSDPEEILDGEFVKKILIFPDKLSMDYNQTSNFSFSSLDVSGNPLPNIEKATVHLSRLFGIDNDRVYASGFNDYSMWDLDTADETLSSNAWVSTTQSNIKAGGDLTAITTYDSKVIIFKRDFMQQINNNKNPFRITDITNIGAISQKSIQEVSGMLFFCAPDGVYVFTGAYPTKISDKLNIKSFEGAISGSHNGEYYIYLNNTIYVYNPKTNAWGNINIDSAVLSFSEYNGNLYAMTDDGEILKISSGTKTDSWSYTTDLITNKEIDLRRLHKVSLFVYMTEGSNVSVHLYKHDGTNMQIAEADNNTNSNRIINAMLRMSTSYAHKIKFTGSGDVRIYYMELKYSYDGEEFR